MRGCVSAQGAVDLSMAECAADFTRSDGNSYGEL